MSSSVWNDFRKCEHIDYVVCKSCCPGFNLATKEIPRQTFGLVAYDPKSKSTSPLRKHLRSRRHNKEVYRISVNDVPKIVEKAQVHFKKWLLQEHSFSWNWKNMKIFTIPFQTKLLKLGSTCLIRFLTYLDLQSSGCAFHQHLYHPSDCFHRHRS